MAWKDVHVHSVESSPMDGIWAPDGINDNFNLYIQYKTEKGPSGVIWTPV